MRRICYLPATENTVWKEKKKMHLFLTEGKTNAYWIVHPNPHTSHSRLRFFQQSAPLKHRISVADLHAQQSYKAQGAGGPAGEAHRSSSRPLSSCDPASRNPAFRCLCQEIPTATAKAARSRRKRPQSLRLGLGPAAVCSLPVATPGRGSPPPNIPPLQTRRTS